MKKIIGCILIGLSCAVSSWAGTMTYEQAKSSLTQRVLPEFWFGDVKGLAARWDALNRGNVSTICISPGGRPIHLITYGKREEVKRMANFNSATSAREPSAYMDKAARKKPVIFFVGPVHGHEVEGLTGLVNFINIMETGRDLRGRDQSELRTLGKKCRLLIIPAGNPDGIARFEPRTAHGMTRDESSFWSMGTWSDDTIAYWPTSTRLHPRVGDDVGFLGCYFNDDGINLLHDEFFAPMSSEATTILMVAMEAGPDLATSLHRWSQSPVLLRPAYVAMEVQEDVRSLARQYYDLLDKRGLPHKKLFSMKPDGRKNSASFNLTSAIYHISGATSFTFESPHEIAGEKTCRASLEKLLDIQLALYEAMMRYELEKKTNQVK